DQNVAPSGPISGNSQCGSAYTALYWLGGTDADLPANALANLSVLSISTCDAENLASSQLSTRLEELHLSGVILPPLATLEGLVRLRRLDLSNNGLRSLDGLPPLR